MLYVTTLFSVALRVKGRTVVSAISPEDGHNPVTQSALIHLFAGDAVQLEARAH